MSYKQNAGEDGTSERVRFDNTVFYVIDGQKEMADCWYTAPLDQVIIQSFKNKNLNVISLIFFVGLDS